MWLPGLAAKFDPITDGHIDGIACFVRPGVVLFNTCAPLGKDAQKSKPLMNTLHHFVCAENIYM